MKKRALTLLLTAALSAGLLAGCGSSSDSSTAASDSQANAETTDSESDDTAEAADTASDSKGSLRVLGWNSMVGHIDCFLRFRMISAQLQHRPPKDDSSCNRDN